jgi:hypothetical protein
MKPLQLGRDCKAYPPWDPFTHEAGVSGDKRRVAINA